MIFIADQASQTKRSTIRAADMHLQNILILDPICFQPFGHNLAAINRYSKYFTSNGIQCKAHVSKDFPSSSINLLPSNSKLSFSNYYSRTFRPNDKSHETFQVSDADLVNLAEKELRIIIENATAEENLALFFPSIDHYCARALANLNSIDCLSGITIFVRWIGVMENCHYSQSKSWSNTDIIKLLANERFRHSAESRNYASLLSDVSSKNVIATPTYVFSDAMPYPNASSNEFRIAFPGSAREDKGFLKIKEIIDVFQYKYPDINLKVATQMLPPQELTHHYNNVRDLLKYSNVKMYPYSISQQQLDSYIADSQLIVAPYCKHIYEHRSSAMMAEAACYERQIIATAHCGFSDDILDLSLGQCCETIADFADSIYTYATMENSQLKMIGEQGRRKFVEYTQKSYNEYFFS